MGMTNERLEKWYQENLGDFDAEQLNVLDYIISDRIKLNKGLEKARVEIESEKKNVILAEKKVVKAKQDLGFKITEMESSDNRHQKDLGVIKMLNDKIDNSKKSGDNTEVGTLTNHLIEVFTRVQSHEKAHGNFEGDWTEELRNWWRDYKYDLELKSNGTK